MTAARGLLSRFPLLDECGLPDTIVHGDFHPGNWHSDSGPPAIAAYAPDEGETLAAAGALDGASNDLAGHLLVRPYPGMPDGDGDAYIKPRVLPRAVLRRPAGGAGGRDGREPAARDVGVPGHAVSSRVAFISHPQETIDLILTAVQGS